MGSFVTVHVTSTRTFLVLSLGFLHHKKTPWLATPSCLPFWNVSIIPNGSCDNATKSPGSLPKTEKSLAFGVLTACAISIGTQPTPRAKNSALQCSFPSLSDFVEFPS